MDYQMKKEQELDYNIKHMGIEAQKYWVHFQWSPFHNQEV